MKLLSFAIAFLVILSAACGGDDSTSSDSSSAGDGAAASPTETVNDGAQPTADASSSFVSGIPAGTAVITIGGEFFEFDMLGCASGVGNVGGGGTLSDGSDVTLEIDIRVAEFGPSDIRVKDNRAQVRLDWQADIEVSPAPGLSQVDSVAIGNGAAGGDATFINTAAGGSPEPVKGTYSVNCGS